MRVWDIHPGYLSRQNLLGQHAEIHALYSIITGAKKGYSNHPETLRWQGCPGGLNRIHDLTVLEMLLRDFNHKSPCGPAHLPVPPPGQARPDCYVDPPAGQIEILRQKNRETGRMGRIPVPKSGYEYWAHHKYSVMARGYSHYKEIQSYLQPMKNCSLQEAGELIEMIATIMEKPVTEPALSNTVDHLWGYFKREASGPEKEIYLTRQPKNFPALVRYFYRLAVKYNRIYLLHSTIFADFVEPV